MQDERNQNQIIRKDARECFVESLSDAFPIGRAHFAFASYDVSRPAGHRQTNNIQIYIGMDEILEICRKLDGYTGAVKPPVRRTGNRESGHKETDI